MICTNTRCRQEIPDGSRFCPCCGKKLTGKKRSTKKRGNGQGTAILVGSTWRSIWSEGSYIDTDGKLHYKRHSKSGFASKKEALAYAVSAKVPTSKIPSLRDYYNAWANNGMEHLGKSKKVAYKIAWNRLKSIADKPINELSVADLQNCINQTTTTYYPARDMKTVLSHCFTSAAADGNARGNLSEYVTLPKLNEQEIQPFTSDEVQRMWELYCDGTEFFAYVLLMIYTGMMPGELLKLSVSMIDTDRHEIIGCGLKTDVRKQTPIVYPDLIDPLVQHLIRSAKKGRIYPHQKKQFYKKYHETLIAAKIRDLPPYACRHTSGTKLALSGIAPSMVQKLMRHSKFTTTQRYIHPDVSDAQRAMNEVYKN